MFQEEEKENIEGKLYDDIPLEPLSDLEIEEIPLEELEKKEIEKISQPKEEEIKISESEIQIKPVQFDVLANNIRYEINKYLKDVSMLMSSNYEGGEWQEYTTGASIFAPKQIDEISLEEKNETTEAEEEEKKKE